MTQMIGEFKETEIGQIPIEWDLTELSELATRFHGGGTPSTKKSEYWNGSIPWTTSAHISDQIFLDKFAGKITAEGVKKSSTQVVPKQNLLIGTRVGVGKVAINLLDTAISQDLTAMIVDKSKVDLLFLAYAISWDITQRTILSGARGTTIKGIPRADLVKVSIPLPPVDEQRRIAAVLTAIQDAIAAQEDVIAAARAFKRSLMHRVFTYGPGRVPAETKETEIGEIPSHWEVVELGEVVDYITGYAFKSGEYTEDDSAPMLLRGDNIAQGSLRWENVKRWPNPVDGTYKKYWLKHDDVVLAMDRPWIPAGMKIARVRKDDLPSLLVQRVARMRTTNRTSSIFLSHVLSGPRFTNYVLAVQTGTSVPHISGKQIKEFVLPWPEECEQKQVVEMLEAVQDRINTGEDRKAALDALFKSMLHQLMTGQIRLMGDEELLVQGL